MAFTTELLFLAVQNHLKILEVPINLNSRKYGSSKVSLFLVLRTILTCTLIYYLKKIRVDISQSFLKRITDKIYQKLE